MRKVVVTLLFSLLCLSFMPVAGGSVQGKTYSLNGPIRVTLQKLEYQAGEQVRVSVTGTQSVGLHNGITQSTQKLSPGNHTIGIIPMKGGVYSLVFMSDNGMHFQAVTLIGQPAGKFVAIPAPVLSRDTPVNLQQMKALQTFLRVVPTREFTMGFLSKYSPKNQAIASASRLTGTMVFCSVSAIPGVGAISSSLCISNLGGLAADFMLDYLFQAADHMAASPAHAFSAEDARLVKLYLVAAHNLVGVVRGLVSGDALRLVESGLNAGNTLFSLSDSDVAVAGKALTGSVGHAVSILRTTKGGGSLTLP